MYLCIHVSVLQLILKFIRFLSVKNVMQSQLNFLDHKPSAVCCDWSETLDVSVFQSEIYTFAKSVVFIYRNRKFMRNESGRWCTGVYLRPGDKNGDEGKRC